MGFQSDEPQNSQACPTPRTLRDWADGRNDPTPAENAHLSGCASCQSILDAFTHVPELGIFQRVDAMDRSDFRQEIEFRNLMRSVPARPIESTEPDLNADGNPETEEESRAATNGVFGDEHDRLTPEELQCRLPSRYKIQRLLAAGGAGMVFLGYDEQLACEVAIKVLSRDSRRDRQRFQREAKILAETRHPNIVRIFDIGTLNDSRSGGGVSRQYLVMEYVGGGTADRLSRDDRATLPGQARFQRMAQLLGDAAQGVHAIHQLDLIHRDLKPSNLLITNDGDLLKVADFGLARPISTEVTMVTQTGDVVGTPEFMSPEQVSSDQNLSLATDVYGLGATLYYLLTRTLMYQGAPAAILRQIQDATPVAPRILNPEIPVDLETICLKAIEKEPESRYVSAEELAGDLQRFAAGQPIEARPVSLPTKVLRYLRRNPSLSWAVSAASILALLLLFGSVTAAFVFGRQNRALENALEQAQHSKHAAEDALEKSIEAADQLLVSVAQSAELLPRTPGSQEVSRALLERARAYFQSFLATHAENTELTFELARAHSGLAEIAARLGEPDAVHREASAALELVEQLTRTPSPDAAKVLELKADTLINYGNFHYNAGEVKTAIEQLTRALETCDAAGVTNRADETTERGEHEVVDGTSPRIASLRGLALRGLADAEIVDGQEDSALEHLAQAAGLFEKLCRAFPDNSAYARDLALVDMSFATTAIDRGELTEGKDHLQSALRVLDSIEKDASGSLRVGELRGVIQTNLGLAERRMGNTAAAQIAYDAAIAQHRRLIELEPSVNEHQWNLVTATLNSGGPMLDQGQMEPLVRRWQSIVPVLEELILAEPDTMRYLQVKAMLQSNIAIVLRDMGKLEEAIEPLQEATKTLRQQSAKVGDSPEAYLPVALNHYELGVTLLQLGRSEEALAALDDSEKVAQDLLEDNADFVPARGHQLDVLLARFDVLESMATSSSTTLRLVAERAIELSSELVAQQPDVVDYQMELPLALINLGRVEVMEGQYAAALQTAQRAIESIESSFEFPLEGRQAMAYKNALLLRAECLDQQLQDEELDTSLRQSQEGLLRKSIELAVEHGATEAEVERFAPGNFSR